MTRQEIIILDHIWMPVWQIQIQKLPFGANPPGNMFQKKIDKILKELPNVFGIADDILAVGYNDNGRDHDNTTYNATNIQKSISEIKQRHMSFQVFISPIFGEIISRHDLIQENKKH